MKPGDLVKYKHPLPLKERIGIVIRQSNSSSDYFHVYFGSGCEPISIYFLELIE